MANVSIRIKLLSEPPDWLPVIAEWIYHEWWTHIPDASPDTLAELLQSNLTSDSIPLSLVATVNEDPIGTVSLLEHDVDTDQWSRYTPWLAALYVEPEHRRLGVGTRLVAAATDISRSLGIDVLYLLTSGEEAFYTKRGWEPIDRADSRVIMSISTAGTDTAAHRVDNTGREPARRKRNVAEHRDR